VKVRDVIRRIEADGWYLARTTGSHRQFKHPTKRGLVTVPGKPGADLAIGTLMSIWETGADRRRRLMRYAIVIEKANGNYSAYVPDLPGCIATGVTVEETEREIREAIQFHHDGLREEGLPIPEPTSRVEYVEA